MSSRESIRVQTTVCYADKCKAITAQSYYGKTSLKIFLHISKIFRINTWILLKNRDFINAVCNMTVPLDRQVQFPADNNLCYVV